MTKGFNLLMKWVPGIEKLNRSDMLMETVKYIKELQNKIKELEKECTDSAQREPLMPDSYPTDLDTGISEKRNKEKRVYRKDMTKGFNLLRKCLPGTRKLFRIDMLMKTVSYIKELQNKIKEVKKESLKESKKRVKYIKELENKIKELEKESKRVNYIKELENKIKELEKESTSQTVMERDTDCTDSAPREPLMPQRSFTDLDTGLISYSSEMADLTTVVATTRTGASESSRETSCAMDDHSAILESLRNKILGTPTGTSESWRETSSPMDVTVRTTSEAEWVIASPEEEELPEFNTVEDLRQWLGLCSPMDATVQTTSEEEELPEFNTAEDLRQWLGL
jgi:hypothetical protein